MQELHARSWDPGTVLNVRQRRWRLVRVDDEVASDGPAMVDLDPLTPGTGDALRLAVPPDLLEVVTTRPARRRPRTWARQLPSVTRPPGDETCAAVARAHAQALPYQWVPTLALLSGRVRRILLADAVGMGKTVQAALVLAELHARRATARTLIVTPAGLTSQWTNELAHRVGLHAVVLDGTTLAARSTGGAGSACVEPGETCLISIDMLRQPEVLALVTRCVWQLLVVDEAHLLAPATARAAAVSRLASVSGQLLLLSATPFSGDRRADRSLVTLGRDARTHDRLLLVARTTSDVAPRAPLRQRTILLDAASDEAVLLAALDRYVCRALAESAGARESVEGAGHLAALLLRRRACSSRAALARTIARRLQALAATARPSLPRQAALPLVDDDGEEADWLGVPAWRDRRDELATLHAMARQARGLRGPGVKLRWIARWLMRVREPALVFTDYVDTLRALRAALPAATPVGVLHGGLSPGQRALVVDRFTRGGIDVLLATDAAAEGLNLHARCRLVVHVDVPWTPRRLAQRNGRVDRFGQTRQAHSLLLAVRSVHDADALQRLTQRAQAITDGLALDDDGLVVLASPRRERLARAALDATRRGSPACTGARHGRSAKTPPRRTIACVSPRRGRRIAERMHAAGAGGVLFVELAMRAVHPLVQPRRWVGMLTGCADPTASRRGGDEGAADIERLLLASWRALAPVRRFVARARWRAARWSAIDARAMAGAPPTADADLFLDTGPRGAWAPAEDPQASLEKPQPRVGRVHRLSWRR